jgi:hypothetical protein
MTDEKKKAERHFNWQALKEAVERMKPELAAASEATHKYGVDETPEDSDFDRTVALGYVVESLEGLCGPHLWVLNVSAVSTYETDLAVLGREDFWLIVAFRGSEDETEIHSG